MHSTRDIQTKILHLRNMVSHIRYAKNPSTTIKQALGSTLLIAKRLVLTLREGTPDQSASFLTTQVCTFSANSIRCNQSIVILSINLCLCALNFTQGSSDIAVAAHTRSMLFRTVRGKLIPIIGIKYEQKVNSYCWVKHKNFCVSIFQPNSYVT